MQSRSVVSVSKVLEYVDRHARSARWMGGSLLVVGMLLGTVTATAGGPRDEGGTRSSGTSAADLLGLARAARVENRFAEAEVYAAGALAEAETTGAAEEAEARSLLMELWRRPRPTLCATGPGESSCSAVTYSTGGRAPCESAMGGAESLDTETSDTFRTHCSGEFAVYGAPFLPGGTRVAIGTDQGSLKIFTPEGPSQGPACEGHNAAIAALEFSPDGTLLASADVSGALKIWLGSNCRVYLDIDVHRAPIMALVFSPDGRFLASGDSDGTVHIWDLSLGHASLALSGPWGHVRALSFSADGRTLAVVTEGPVWIWDVSVVTASPVETSLRWEDERAEVVEGLSGACLLRRAQLDLGLTLDGRDVVASPDLLGMSPAQKP